MGSQLTPRSLILSSSLSRRSDLPAPQADLARMLLNATRAFEHEMMARLATAGLEMLTIGHFPVLRGLDPDHGARASTLARDAGVTRQAIAQVVAELEQLGIVEQTPDPTDARAKIVRYTPFGLDGYHRAMAVFTDLEREAARRIRPDRIAALKQDLQRLAQIRS
jgi:DNA-binding MarR family transcriptional regulator